MFLSDMGVLEALAAMASGLVWPQGKNGGSQPDRVDQLVGLCTPFRTPVSNVPGVHGKGDTILVG